MLQLSTFRIYVSTTSHIETIKDTYEGLESSLQLIVGNANVTVTNKTHSSRHSLGSKYHNSSSFQPFSMRSMTTERPLKSLFSVLMMKISFRIDQYNGLEYNHRRDDERQPKMAMAKQQLSQHSQRTILRCFVTYIVHWHEFARTCHVFRCVVTGNGELAVFSAMQSLKIMALYHIQYDC